MKRATLTALPAAGITAIAEDLTDRLLACEPAPANLRAASQPKPPSVAPRRRAPRTKPQEAERTGGANSGDSLEPALRAAEQAVAALQLAARSEPARYEVALRYRLDSLAHHVQQVRDYVAAAVAR